MLKKKRKIPKRIRKYFREYSIILYFFKNTRVCY